MKKIIILVTIVLIAAGSLFAADSYPMDAQILYNMTTPSVTIKNNGITQTVAPEPFISGLTVQSYKLFKLNESVCFGFMFGGNMNGSLSETVQGSIKTGALPASPVTLFSHLGMSGFAGPAVSFTIGDIVRFEGAAALAASMQRYGFRNINVVSIKTTGIGFSLDAQAKFFPSSPVHFIIGYRLSDCFNHKYTSLDKIVKQDIIMDVDSVQLRENSIYIGLSRSY